jgi:disulfide bond formation protein DsbB
MDALLSICLGIGLSAACGFRIFVPLLIMSIASLSGHLELSHGFEWIGTYPALVAFGTASIIEISAYYIPWLDNLLDTIAAPTAFIAGTVVMASSVSDMSPFLRWTLALIVGGGVAGTVQGFTSITRVTSSATTGGLGNHILSTLEAGGSTALSILSIAMPAFAGIAVLVVLYFALKKVFRRLFKQTDLKTQQE